MLDSARMDPKDLRTLELPAVLERLAEFTDFSASSQLALQLTPTSYHEIALRLQAETAEARQLQSDEGGLTIGGAHDVRGQAEAAARGSVLEPHELLDVQSTLIASRTLARRFDRQAERFPVLSEIAAGLAVDTGLVNAITRVLDDRGQVKDGASKQLGRIRHQLRAVRERLVKRLERMVADPKTATMLQEPIVTQREGRFVIPLRAEFKGRIEAVVHDQSSSGATLFIEPLSVVEANNELRELELAERDEVRRILAELSASVGEQQEALTSSVEALAGLDLAFAKARYAEALDASQPVLHRSQDRAARLRFQAARHPLLPPESVVAIDLLLEPDVKALVITGPNTGGKTVTLKTAGLLAAMAQCGLQLPVADGSEAVVYDAIYADIGDEQSIEQSLSTFSSHISNIIRILGMAGQRSMVLLDELGAGTDPGEGAALARSLLSEFIDRVAITLVATHYPELKLFAHHTPGVLNANVEFDLHSLRPTYHLRIGLPGRSNALAIAERLGLGDQIIERARTELSPDELQADSLLEDIRAQREASEQAKQAAEIAAMEARQLRDQLQARLEGIDEERQQILESARAEGRQEAEQVRLQLKQLRGRLAALGEDLDRLEQAERDLERVAEQLEAPEERPPDDGEVLEDLAVGDRVRLRSIAAEGVVTALSPGHAEVQVGSLRVRADLDDLGPPDAEPEPPAPARRAIEIKLASGPPPVELNVRGSSVEAALQAVERRVDAAYLAGMPMLRVIHGKGTGALRQAIREWLADSPYVVSAESGPSNQGGDGVTVVKLDVD